MVNVFVVHDVRTEPYTDDEKYSKVYGVYSTREAAQAKRVALHGTPGGPWFADITETTLDA